MTDLWFDRELGRLSRRGALLYAARADGIWAVLVSERTFPDDLGQESHEALGLYAASATGAGHLLLGDGVALPAELAQWSTAPTAPLSQLGPWEPCLISVNRSAQLALSHDFGGLRAWATTCADRHITALTPSSDPLPALVERDDLDAPPPGWDQHGPEPRRD